MKGVDLQLDDTNAYLDLVIHPAEVGPKLDVKSLIKAVTESQYSSFYLFEENVKKALDAYRQANKVNQTSAVIERIAERRDEVV
jgi:hypothetical protein